MAKSAQLRVGAELPDDLESCHSIILELMNALEAKDTDITLLKQRLHNLLREKFGRRTEKLTSGQLSLFRDLVEKLTAVPQDSSEQDTADANTASVSETSAGGKKKKNGGGGRKPLNSSLPREPRHYYPDGKDMVCSCGQRKEEFGHESVEQLDYVPASFKVIEHITHKFCCKACQEGVVEGKRPAQIFNGGKATEGLVAQVATAKYVDHSPLYRQEQTYAREGAEVNRSSMGRYLERGAGILKVVWNKMLELALENEVVQADETPIRFIMPERAVKKVKNGYCWTLYGGNKYPYVIYDVQPDRSSERAKALLNGFRNYLLTDGYGGYDWYDKAKSANCNVHFRRYFEKAKNYDKEKSEIILSLYTKLYAIESRIKGLDSREILAVRQQETAPIMNRIKGYLDEWKLAVPPKTPLGVAINYGLTRWEKLCRFVEHGFLPPDTNLVENSIRPIAIGRKNWLHIGSEEAMETASIFMSLTTTCKRLGVNPFLYLRDALIRLGKGEVENIEELLPDRWENKNSLPQASQIEPVNI